MAEHRDAAVVKEHESTQPLSVATQELFAAVIAGNVAAATIALQNGADITAVYQSNNLQTRYLGYTALNIAVRAIDRHMVQLLLEYNRYSAGSLASQLYRYLQDILILEIPILENAVAIVILLVKHGADINLLDGTINTSCFEECLTVFLSEKTKFYALKPEEKSELIVEDYRRTEEFLKQMVDCMLVWGADIEAVETTLPVKIANRLLENMKPIDYSWRIFGSDLREREIQYNIYVSKIHPLEKISAAEIITYVKERKKYFAIRKISQAFYTTGLPAEMLGILVEYGDDTASLKQEFLTYYQVLCSNRGGYQATDRALSKVAVERGAFAAAAMMR